VVLDHAQTARMAADHLVERGLKNFLYYSDEANWTPDERGKAFIDRLAEYGYRCKWIKWHTHKPSGIPGCEWAERRAWLVQRLTEGPTPVGIFADKGALALEIYEVCRGEGIDVPQEVALIGIEDELLAAQTTPQAITTIEPNFEDLGYQGAKCLDALMRGQQPSKTPIRVAPKRIIARKSTDISRVNHAGLAKALSFIAEHFSEGIDGGAVARHAGMSRRGLHNAFTQHLNRTPGEQLRAVRMERAKKLLIESDSKVAEVARLSGYPSAATFFTVFRQSCGVSPGEYRSRANRGQ
jgi:LacI family transcriptional regulator